MNLEFNLKNKSESDIEIQPGKNKSRLRRGNNVLCLILSPELKTGEFKNLLMEETLLSDKIENLKFLIVAPPALQINYGKRVYPIFVCDAGKGVTVNLDFSRDKEYASLYIDPHMLSNIFDITFLSKASNIKPDIKQLVAIAFGGFISGGLVGLLF